MIGTLNVNSYDKTELITKAGFVYLFKLVKY